MEARKINWIVTAAEILILFLVGIWLDNEYAGESLLNEIFIILSVVIVLNRIATSVEITDLVNNTFGKLNSPIKYLADSVAINAESSVEEIKQLLNAYLQIQNTDLTEIKDSIVRRTITNLQELNFQQKTPILDEPDFYNLLYTEFEKAEDHIHIVSMDENLEWTDTPEENKYFEVNVQAAQKVKELIRVFVFTDERLREAKSNKHIYGHRKGNPNKLIGKVVNRVRFDSRLPQIIKDAGQGFVIIDDRIVIVDVFSEDGEARGYATFNKNHIRQYNTLFKKFNGSAKDLELD